jgi:hypothetical protein
VGLVQPMIPATIVASTITPTARRVDECMIDLDRFAKDGNVTTTRPLSQREPAEP